MADDRGWDYALIKLSIYFYAVFTGLSLMGVVPEIAGRMVGYTGWAFLIFIAVYLIIAE